MDGGDHMLTCFIYLQCMQQPLLCWLSDGFFCYCQTSWPPRDVCLLYCGRVCVHTHMHVCLCVYVYLFMCVCTCACIRLFVHVRVCYPQERKIQTKCNFVFCFGLLKDYSSFQNDISLNCYQKCWFCNILISLVNFMINAGKNLQTMNEHPVTLYRICVSCDKI